MNKIISGLCILGLVMSLTNVAYSYTELEYNIYKDVMNTPMSVPENEAFSRVGKKYGITPTEVKTIVEKVMQEIHSGGSKANEVKEKDVEDAVNRVANVKSVIVSADFANVGYVYEGEVWDSQDVQEKVLKDMPRILNSIFTVKGIERARLTAFYPAIGGGEKKVAMVECYKSAFNINKTVDKYDLTVYPGQ